MDKPRVIPVAVIGMACRLPGGIDSPDKLWRALLRGDDLITEVPADRWDADEYYDPEPGVPGRSVSRWGGFLDDVGGFDPEFFGISEREATAMDPQHRLLLQTSWEAVEHAGLAPKSLTGSLTGVFVGLAHGDYAFVTGEADALEDPYGFTGLPFSMGSGRVSYAMGLRGPAITVDTACSSSLLAVHMACRSLNDGESDLALAGGCMVMLEPQLYASASALGMLSPTGRCRAFDASADGFVRSEGCAVVLLKRLPDALRDGDRILGVLRGTATNQDGRTENISTPSLDAQVVAYRAALAIAGVNAASVGMVEAHGTGTPVGDPIEFASLAQVYGIDRPCALTSAKSNLGHPEAAAGVVGLVKAVLSLQHGLVPPVLHFTRLPDELDQIETKLFVPQWVTPWPEQSDVTPRRAAVSSYGMSGTNVHAVLEQAPATATPRNGTAPSGSASALLFALSASSADALRQTSRRMADWVSDRADDNSVALADLAYTLAHRRAHRPVRTCVVAATGTELVGALREVADGSYQVPYRAAVGHDDRGPVWLFSGQGSQWAGMGTDLLANEPVFAATVAAAEPLIARESGFSVTEAMTAAHTVTGIDRVQPTLFTVQVALAAALRSHGVRPAAVIGHSLGEVAAAVVAGALSLADGVRVICRRSRLCTRISGIGAMASVELPAALVREELASRGIKDVVVAVVASPNSTVIGGATQPVRDLVAAWEARDVMARTVAVDVASHTPQVNPILAELSHLLTDIAPMKPEIAYYSATLFDPRERPVCDARYWSDNLRHMVRFSAAVRAALEDGHRVFGELSPHPLLTRAVEQTAQGLDTPVAAAAAMRREQPMPHGLRGLVAELHSAGAEVDFSLSCPGGQLVDAPLPVWANRRLLLVPGADVRATRRAPVANTVAVHPLLGSHVRLMEEPQRHAWQGEVGTAALPWLRDHQIHRVAALPGAAYCEMALAAAHRVLGEQSEVRDIRFEEMLLLDEGTSVGAVASMEAPGTATFVVQTDQHGEKAQRASATLHAAAAENTENTENTEKQPPAHDVAALLSAYPCRLDGDELREWFGERGIRFGPAFTGLASAHLADGAVTAVLAEVGLPSALRTQRGGFCVHPALLDACFQSVAAHPAVRRSGGIGHQGGLLLPLGARRLRAYAPTRNTRYCFTRVTACGTNVEADIDLMDEHGNVTLVVRGLLMGTGVSQAADRDRLLNERLLTIEWQQRALPEVTAPDAGKWLLTSISPVSGAEDMLKPGLADALKRHGAQCAATRWPPHADDASVDGFTGVVVLVPACSGDPAAKNVQDAVPGSDYVQRLVRVARELPNVSGQAPRLYLVTRGAQKVLNDDGVNLDQAGSRGLLRVIGAEHPYLRPTHIDVDERTNPEQLARQLLSGTEEDETAWRNDEWYTARLCTAPLRPDERKTTVVDHRHDGVRLQIRTPGDLQTMELAAVGRVPPGTGEIEVAVSASSVNFADVLVAFGRYPAYPDFSGLLGQLGTDFAGVVSAVGPDVTDHRVGDHVGGMTSAGCWGSFVTCDARLATTVPPGLTDAEAAAITTAHATAWYGLTELAHIKAEDKVLIHSATGGVGQAAIAIARAAGAEIFATAGSPNRRELLRDMGIKHVYDSRSIEFAERIRRDTDGYGVDVVLNSLTGAAQRAGIKLLSFGGRFVEIGKRDIYDDTRLGLFPFRRNLMFYAVDLGLMSITHPAQIRELLTTVYRLTADGTLPLPDSTHYPLAEAATAIRVMSAAEHTGKLILDIPQTGRRGTAVLPPEQVRIFRPDGAYIITGGLGGLGLFLAEKMASGGAGRIVLACRSAPDQRALETIELIRATGSDVVVERADVAQQGTAQRLVATATASGLPLRGVLHAAAVVEDATLTNISNALIDRNWAPKVHGAWHLHWATTDQPLDWFCSFSSAAALLGSPGQGAYAAANSWLDAFTYWRRAQGLPATAIAWAAWAEIGRGAGLAASGDTAMISPDEGGYAFEALLRHDRTHSGYAPTIGSPWLTSLAQRSKFAEAFRSTGPDRSDSGKLRAELTDLPLAEWPGRLRRLISEQIGVILRRNVDPDRPLSEYGLDSLGNLELRTRIETETGIRSASTDITTVRDLAERLCEKLADFNADVKYPAGAQP